MALFKIERGTAENLMSNRPTIKDGFAYFTTDDGKFYIDVGTDNQNAIVGKSTSAKPGVNRVCINLDPLVVTVNGSSYSTQQEAIFYAPTNAIATSMEKRYLLGSAATDSVDTISTNSSVYTQNGIVYGAAWNDYAEFRYCKSPVGAGRSIKENGDDSLSVCTDRLQPGAMLVSDTFGFSIGETELCKTPVAVSGRVLAYPYEDRQTYRPGEAVCSGPKGTVSRMTREEIMRYPERIIGVVSAIPDYENWGTGKVPVNGRIWIKVK